MTCLLVLICAILFLFNIYLVARCWPPRIPGQLGFYGPGLGARLTVGVVNTVLLAVSVSAATANVWPIWLCCVGGVGLCLWLLGREFRVIAWSEELLVVQTLTGAPQTYRWEDVSACAVRAEAIRGRGRLPVTYHFDMYRLTLPDRVIDVNGGEDAGIRLLQVLERRRPDLKAVRAGKIQR